MPILISTPAAWHDIRKTLTGRVGFVPTMGNLHEGHLALIAQALDENDTVVVSIFINPTQFNDAADYEKYLRTLENDCAKLDALGVGYVFNPDKETMYPDNYEIQVSETVITDELEGVFRPGHFTGMLTIVLKLLNIINADNAYFGEKDFQQFQLVRKMATALFLPTKITGCATVREDSGLALSSRNARLTREEKTKAALLYQYLQDQNMTDQDIYAALEQDGFKPEYVETKWGRRLAAVWLGNVRLIDNVAIKEENRHAVMS